MWKQQKLTLPSSYVYYVPGTGIPPLSPIPAYTGTLPMSQAVIPPSSNKLAFLGLDSHIPPLSPAGILPDGKVLITELGRFIRPIYLYDPSKEELEHVHPAISMGHFVCPTKEELKRVRFSWLKIFDHWMESFYYEENVIPLKCYLTRK